MASASLRDDLTCPVCLSLFTDPVILPCGHSFCRDCICLSLTQQPQCPQCRAAVSTQGPCLLSNHALRSLVEKTKEAQQKPDYTPEKQNGQWMCSEHEEKLKLYCMTDQQLTCVICRDGQKHESHKFKPVKEAAALVRTELEKFVTEIRDDINTLEGLAESQRDEMTKTKGRSDELKRLLSSQFREMYMFLKKRECELYDKMKSEEEDGFKRMFERLSHIEEAIAESKKLENSATSILEIQEAESFLKLWSGENEAKAARSSFQTKGGKFHVEKTHLSLGPYESHLQMFIWKEMLQIIRPREEQLPLQSDGTTLRVSPDKTSVFTCPNIRQKCLVYDSARSIDLLAGQHYWEVFVGQQKDWEVGLPQCVMILSSSNQYTICTSHNNGIYLSYNLEVQNIPSKIGLYLDCFRKELSFYDADDMKLIFTESLTSSSFPVSAHFKLGQASIAHCPIRVCRY